MSTIDRRDFLVHASALATGTGLISISSSVLARQTESAAAPDAWFEDGFPRQPANRVREVVGAAHRDLAKVKSLVDEHPALVNATWDWGFGDWETPLGAASHVGQPEIAEYLLAKGARPDIFCAAMLGWIDVVKSLLTANPSLAQTHGPHGITLLAHARAGGEQAQAVFDYLQELGTADPVQTSLPMSDAQRDSYLATYVSEQPPVRFEIIKNKQGNLSLKTPDGGERTLFRVAEHEFHPTGARAVRLRFEMGSASSQSVTIYDGQARLTVSRAK